MPLILRGIAALFVTVLLLFATQVRAADPQKFTVEQLDQILAPIALFPDALLAQVLVAKYLDHLPLYRQEAIFGRAGHLIARSTLAQWVGECGVQLQPLVDALAAELLRQPVLHADETPVAMLKPGHGKTHRA